MSKKILYRMSINVLSTLDYLALRMKTLIKRIQQLSHVGIEHSNITCGRSMCLVTKAPARIIGLREYPQSRCLEALALSLTEINLTESEPGEGWTCAIYLPRRYWFDLEHKIGSKIK